MARTLLNGLETLKTFLEDHWKCICQNSYLRYKVIVSYSSSNDFMKIGTISKVIFSKTLIKSHHLVSPGQSIQKGNEWRFMPFNMNLAFPPMLFPISTSFITMPSSTKATSTSKSLTTLSAKQQEQIHTWQRPWKGKKLWSYQMKRKRKRKGKAKKKYEWHGRWLKSEWHKNFLRDLETEEASFCQWSVGKSRYKCFQEYWTLLELKKLKQWWMLTHMIMTWQRN